MLGHASLPEGFHNEVYTIHQWLQLNFVHNAWFEIWLGHVLQEKKSPLSYPKLSNIINSLAVPKQGSDLPPSVGRSGSALANGSAIDAKVSWCPEGYRIKITWIIVCYVTWQFSQTWIRHVRLQASAINEFQRNVIQTCTNCVFVLRPSRARCSHLNLTYNIKR